MYAYRRFTFIGIVLASVAGCGNDDAGPAKGGLQEQYLEYFDAQLAEVSSELAFMDFMLKVNAEVHCAVADALLSTLEDTTDQEATKELMNDLSQKAQGRCATYKTTLSASLPVVQLVKERGRIPSPIYSFIIVEEVDKTYQEVEVGPFASESVCIEIENIARKAGLATITCKVWKTSRSRRTSLAPFTPNPRFK